LNYEPPADNDQHHPDRRRTPAATASTTPVAIQRARDVAEMAIATPASAHVELSQRCCAVKNEGSAI
jgi:hypothetical protein